ncbi:acetoin dehydrogenase dihydrolipoyllysine-residue acetyltransferase subunit [Arenibaculum pallidiluteum]|uniref:acetoin dehydrogenase dihydrolipoyllysine-residue acetyltransferase subunit n=1 Tax=Arenibaculum pallidiluteum TaxID=2812559 RepID=UPI001A96A5EC|nr:acetoin dehydrogenase dihydrolipoyllysine-residue acetyltransferase subunit [Arenibaculum pallidiluteum]
MTDSGSAAILTLPRLGETMEEGRVVAWTKSPGEGFRRGETLLEVETDKTVVEVPALADGVLLRTLVAPGEMVAVDAPIAEIRGEGHLAPARAETAAPNTSAPARPASAPAADAPPSGGAAGPRSAPGARRLARREGIALDTVRGTGRLGRITREDVMRAAGGDPPVTAVQGSMLAIPGGRLNVRSWAGAGGPTVVLVHGFTGDLLTWSGLAALLQRSGCEVVALDLPGHGFSEAPGETPDALVEALCAAVATLGLQRVHLVGHSMGGALAVMAAEAMADRILGLSLLAPAGFGTEIDQVFLDGMLGAATPQALAREIAKLSYVPVAISDDLLALAVERLRAPERNRRLRAIAAHLARDGVQQLHVAPRLAGLSCPVRVLWGREDSIVPWRHALAAPGRVALHLFERAGHMPHWDQAEAVAAVLAHPPQ